MAAVGYDANKHPRTREFMAELRALMARHNLYVVPTHEGDISLHDPMTVVEAPDEGIVAFYERVIFEEEDPPAS